MKLISRMKVLMVNAVMTGLLTVAGCGGDGQPKYGVQPKYGPLPPYGPSPVYITETEARESIKTLFAAEGVTFTEDYAFTREGVEFEADGYEGPRKIGYEFISQDDEAETDPAMALSSEEQTALDGLYTSGDEYVEVFSFRTYMYETDLNAAINALETDVQAFIDDLKNKGVLNP